MKAQFILDPLWITKGRYLDPEYFNYVLLDASMKYKQEIAEDNIDRFYEVLFHILNLNSLAVKGNLFTARFKEIWNDPRILQIQKDLKVLYETQTETAEIFKNANFVFLNLIIEYLQKILMILDSVKMVYVNQNLHTEKEIFVLTNLSETKDYTVWRFAEDPKKNFGYSFTKVRKIRLSSSDGADLNSELGKLDDPKLKALSAKKNLCLALIFDQEDERLVAKAVKDMILLNKGIAKGVNFEPTVVAELYRHLWVEKILPFTLDQWVFEGA
jgi:hypothetical protein